MKYIYYLQLSIILFGYSIPANAKGFAEKTSLSGKITDKETGTTIPGVTIYIPDLKTGAISKIDGTYIIEDLPTKKVLVQVSFLGYKTIIETIDLSTTIKKDFVMESAIKEMNEVVVTGHSQAGEKNRTPTPISIVNKTELLQNSATNIIDAIATQPGISQITTGSGISKPVIRGLGYNRVVVVNDGIRQEGQQWGDEHGIEVDEFSVNKVEILKGPASLSYGSDAIAGVVNMISEQTQPLGTITANAIANYQTNNGLIGYSLNTTGNSKGFIWDARYSNKMAYAYQNKYDGYVYNSGYKENNFSAIFGLNKSWGYSHLHFSSYSLIPGLIEGTRDSATGDFIKPIIINDSTLGYDIASDKDFKSYTQGIPYQNVKHVKILLNNSFIIGKSSLKLIAGFQQNKRKEYGNPFHKGDYGLYFLMNTINYDVRYILPEKNGFDISFGANGMQQSSQNKGIKFLVPEYSLFDIGVFTIIKKSFSKFDISGGIRYDIRNENTKDLYIDSLGAQTSISDNSSYHQFTAIKNQYNGISGSIGATYQFSEKVFTKFNIARGYRAPNIGEIASNGEHEGTMRYELGNINLKPENSWQFDFALGINTEHVSAEIDVFNNNIDNFIFSRKLSSLFGGDSITNGITTFQFVSGNANLTGGEIIIDIHPHPLDWLHFENSFSYVQSIQKGESDSTKYLPFTPAPKLQSELRANIKNMGKTIRNAYIKIGMENYFEQNQFYSAYGTETATPAYMLINAGLGTDLNLNKKTLCSIFISVSNLTDVAYQSHLSRLKYGEINNMTGRTGIYNMGRNISIKLLIPINIKG